MASWSEVVAFSQALTLDGAHASGNDQSLTYRVMSDLPVIVWDGELKRRKVVMMRWGFPKPGNWRIPQPIHARSETIDTTPAFADAFASGGRGIVLVRDFNEAPDVPGIIQQHTIKLGDAQAVGIAFVWRRFKIDDADMDMFACAMVTVPANSLISALPTDRMPALLTEDDWTTWLGETGCSASAAKACLRTVEGASWTMTREEQAIRSKRSKPTVRDPKGLF